ncbi:MAG: ABC transporter ATP-binding protein [Bacteroidales bacterium]|jgi:lipoprotein-releasing system ATP-binding protein|nr:ABC transporter ATP-binding protein [Bacteroidales bacterium]
MIIIENIYKSYGNLEVLKGINFSVKRSEIVSVLGASGAGKTTLLQIIGTLLKPDKGKVLIDNVDTFSLNEKELAKFRNLNIGFVFQFHHLLPEFTALENICIPGLIAKKNKNDVQKKAIKLLEALNINDRAGHKPNELSGGEKQRVAIARSLINDPSIILADEPSGNLDSKNAKDLYNIIFSLRKTFEQTFIIVTHNEEHAKLTDRMFEIKDGVICENMHKRIQ